MKVRFGPKTASKAKNSSALDKVEAVRILDSWAATTLALPADLSQKLDLGCPQKCVLFLFALATIYECRYYSWQVEPASQVRSPSQEPLPGVWEAEQFGVEWGEDKQRLETFPEFEKDSAWESAKDNIDSGMRVEAMMRQRKMLSTLVKSCKETRFFEKEGFPDLSDIETEFRMANWAQTERCETCEGKGRLRINESPGSDENSGLCETCEGAGWVNRVPYVRSFMLKRRNTAVKANPNLEVEEEEKDEEEDEEEEGGEQKGFDEFLAERCFEDGEQVWFGQGRPSLGEVRVPSTTRAMDKAVGELAHSYSSPDERPVFEAAILLRAEVTAMPFRYLKAKGCFVFYGDPMDVKAFGRLPFKGYLILLRLAKGLARIPLDLFRGMIGLFRRQYTE